MNGPAYLWVLHVDEPMSVMELSRALSTFQARFAKEPVALELSADAARAVEAEVGQRPDKLWGVPVRRKGQG